MTVLTAGFERPAFFPAGNFCFKLHHDGFAINDELIQGPETIV